MNLNKVNNVKDGTTQLHETPLNNTVEQKNHSGVPDNNYSEMYVTANKAAVQVVAGRSGVEGVKIVHRSKSVFLFFSLLLERYLVSGFLLVKSIIKQRRVKFLKLVEEFLELLVVFLT